MFDKFKKEITDVEKIKNNPSLGFLRKFTNKDELWDFQNKKAVALGFAIGSFLAFLLPIFQFFFAAIMAIILRANLPLAMFSTLITNPFTFVPIYLFAFGVGNFFLNVVGIESKDDVNFEKINFQGILDLGLPLFLGLFIIGSVVSFVGGLLIYLFWNKNKNL